MTAWSGPYSVYLSSDIGDRRDMGRQRTGTERNQNAESPRYASIDKYRIHVLSFEICIDFAFDVVDEFVFVA
jgi:hypothetical protein